MSNGIRKYSNDHHAVSKDDIVSSLIPEYVSECALMLQLPADQPCSTDDIIAAVARATGQNVEAAHDNPQAVVVAAKTATGCETERCVLEALGDKIGREIVAAEIETRFKLVGPNGIELLSNFDIDGTLRQWTDRFREFYPYNFNMANYAEYSIVDGRVVNRPDTLATVSFEDLYAGGKTCGGCVINTDVYQGRGKHWMALFFDARGDGAEDGASNPQWSVEFFNSGGNGPGPEWVNWLLKTEQQMNSVAKSLHARGRVRAAPTVRVVRANSIRHQHSKTECGLYSLFYIYARLSGVPYSYFHETPVPDQLMFELRQHLFLDTARKTQPGVADCKFSFDTYAKQVKIEWEAD